MALGEKLKKARLDQGLTASEVAAMTRMKVQMVEDLEREDFSKVAATIYGKGFIRLYAEQVGLDPAPLIDEYLTRFVDPAHGGKRPRHEQAEEEEKEEEFEKEESEGDILSRVVSFFKPSSGGEDEEDEQDKDIEPEPKTPYFPPTREEPTKEPEPVKESYEPEAEEPEPQKKTAPRPRPEPERDLFSMTQPELIPEQEPSEPEPEEEDVEEFEPEPEQEPKAEPRLSEPIEDEEDEEVGPSVLEVFGEKMDFVKEVIVEMGQRFKQICSDIALDLKLQTRKLLMKLPDIKSLDLSWNSMPVMITLVLIAVLLISGLASIIRRAHSDTDTVEDVAVEEPTQEQVLRIVVNPPEPYYE